MTPDVTLKDGTELYVFESTVCRGCFFDSAGKCTRRSSPEIDMSCSGALIGEKDISFLTKEEFLIRTLVGEDS